jgi:predicted AlkP superfamily phosphohydrolase/phosphomutase
MPARALVIGLDGATFDLIEPWKEALPHLARLMDAGVWCRLRSTVPPVTFPAWTSLATGVNPGRHGIFDFTQRVAGTYRVEFVNATYRQQPSVWHLLSQAGRRVGVMGLPAAYPPEAVNGFFISGFDSPVATGIDRSFVHPPELYDEVRRAVGAYEITDFQELRVGPGWHEMAMDRLLHAARRRTEIAAYLLDREAWDCFFVHFGESDTVAHHFWAFHDRDSPRYDAEGARKFGNAIRTVYQALDEAVGELVERAGNAATVLIVSDHGSGGTGAWVVHLNRWLEQQGWLSFAPTSAAGRGAERLKRLGLALPAGLQEWVFRGPVRCLASRLESGARLGGIDWAGTHAFSEEVNTLPGLWLNVRGREPAGIVEPGKPYETLRSEITDRLAELRHPETGEPVVARAWRREELYSGPAVELAPDIVLEPALDRGYAYTFLSSGGQPGDALRKLVEHERLGAKGGSMNGSHLPDGVLIMCGPDVGRGFHLEGAQLVDVAPTLMQVLGVEAPAGLDGCSLLAASPSLGGEHGAPDSPQPEARPRPYSAEESAVVGSRLRGLGYRE